MNPKNFAMIAGVIYLAIGLMGFLPGVVQAPHAEAPDIAVDSGYGYLLGLFAINVLHNIVHLVVGILGLGSARSRGGARTFARGLTIFYGLLAVMGLIPGLNTTFGLIPIFGHDVWLHAITAVIAAYFGWGAREEAYPDATTTGNGEARTY